MTDQTTHARGSDAAFERELLLVERVRLRLTGIILLCPLIFSLGLVAVIGDPMAGSGVRAPIWLLPAIAATVAALPWAALASLRFVGDHTPSTVFRYFTAAVEVSIPSFAILVLGVYVGPDTALYSPMVFGYFLFIISLAMRLDPWIPAFAGTVAGLELLALWAYLCPPGHPMHDNHMLGAPRQLARVMFIVIIGAAAGFLAGQVRERVRDVLRGQEERGHIVALFGSHVSPEVVDALLGQHRELASTTRYVAVMFLDIRSFTTFSEGRSPIEVVDLLNAVFHFMIDLVNEHDGIINKFLGDGFMAVFGAPLSDGQDRENAVRCAQAILVKLQQEQAAGKLPAELRIGIGVHAGEVVTGSIGSAARKEYTVIGDVVNVAARVEAMNKDFQSQILLTGEVWEAVSSLGIEAEALGDVAVKGRKEPIEVYKLA